MKRPRWRKLSELQARYVAPKARVARSWLIAMGVIHPSETTLRRVMLPEGTPVLRVDETPPEEKR